MMKNRKHEKEFDTQTLFTDMEPLMGDDTENTRETTDRKSIADIEIKLYDGQRTQVYEPRPLTPEDDIYDDIIEKFATEPTKPKYWFEEFGDSWSCSCGHINQGDTCESCGLERELLRSLFILHKPDNADGSLLGVKPIKHSRAKKRSGAFNKKIIVAIVVCVVLILVSGAGIYMYLVSSGQNAQEQKLQTAYMIPENLPTALGALWPEDMMAFTAAVNAGKFAYVQKHLSEDDQQALTYMAQLMVDDYPGIQEVFDEYYAWEVSIVANRSESDFETDLETVSRKDTVYFHATLSGGAPDESIELYYEVTWPNGSSEIYGLDSYWQAGSNITARFQYPIPLFGAEGKLTFNLYDKNTKELMGTDTVVFKN